MNGAREYARLFKKTCLYEKLYIVVGRHARGSTFRIYVIPEIKEDINLEEDAVEVYGITSGNPGWSETYGWLHTGPWIDDFLKIVKRKQEEKEAVSRENKKEEEVRKLTLLAKY